MNRDTMLQLLMGNLPPLMACMENYLHMAVKCKIFEGDSLSSYFVENDRYIAYIAQGKCKLSEPVADGSYLDFAFCGKNTIVEKSQINICSYLGSTLEIFACENTVVYLFSSSVFYELIKDDPKLFKDYFDFHDAHILLLQQRTLRSSCLDASFRVLSWLECLSRYIDISPDGRAIIPCEKTQQEIASYLFIHVTTFNRVFASFKKEGIVEKTRKAFIIHDVKRLREILENINPI